MEETARLNATAITTSGVSASPLAAENSGGSGSSAPTAIASAVAKSTATAGGVGIVAATLSECEEPKGYVDDAILLGMWRVVYWTSQLLTWFVKNFNYDSKMFNKPNKVNFSK